MGSAIVILMEEICCGTDSHGAVCRIKLTMTMVWSIATYTRPKGKDDALVDIPSILHHANIEANGGSPHRDRAIGIHRRIKPGAKSSIQVDSASVIL